MLRIVPAARVLAALLFSTALAGGVAIADAKPCLIDIGNGQFAPCAPGVVSHSPDDPGGGNDPASEPAQLEHTLVDTTPPAAEEEPAEEEPVESEPPAVK